MEKAKRNKIFTTLGASNHVDAEREKHDYYATEPRATELLLEVERFSHQVWECACGEGHMSEVLKEHGYKVFSTDLIDRGYGGVYDFMEHDTSTKLNVDIITNPPYKIALEFAKKALDSVSVGQKVAFFVKTLFLEGKARKEFFKECPPKIVYVSSSRLKCAMNGDFEKMGSSAVAYAWFVWEKGFKGDTIVRWIN